MKTKILFSLVLALAFSVLYSQVPQGFNYQAIARDGSGNVIANKSLPFKIDIQTSTGTVIYEETFSSTTSNQFGLITLVVGTGTQTGGTAASFSAINWAAQALYLKTTIQYPGTTWTVMGTSQIWSVPYSVVTNGVAGALQSLNINGTSNNTADSALFEVRNKDGNTVFAVYNEAVRVYVGNSSTKGSKGGFAIGGFGGSKGNSNLMVVNDDSVRIYLDNSPTSKGQKGGFAIGGFNATKGSESNYLDVSIDSTGIVIPAENRILWYPLKNAFLTGKILILNKDSVGVNSFSSGYESMAKGMYSQALGYQAVSRGNYSTAIGNNAVASKTNSFAFGENAQSLNEECYALGRGAIASGWRSFAFGSAGIDSAGQTTGATYAKGDYSFAMGQGSQALGLGSVALGLADTASGQYSLALGYKTKSTGWSTTAMGSHSLADGGTSTAMGWGTIAKGGSATAMGAWTYALNDNATSMGLFTKATAVNSTVIGCFSVASGYTSTAIGYGPNASGWASIALGDSTISSGGSSTSMGTYSVASGSSSTSMGYRTLASGSGSTAMGSHTNATKDNTTSMGLYSTANGVISTAMGDSTVSSGYASTSIGFYTVATGDYSISSGDRTKASGWAATALGGYTKASGGTSTAMGWTTVANGSSTTSMGAYTNAWGDNSASMGLLTRATGGNSTSMGFYTNAKWFSSLVIGQYNDSTLSGNGDLNWNLTDPLFVAGNGSAGVLHNALTLYKNGNMTIAGSLTQNSDIRLKEDISPLSDGIDLVEKINPVYFYFKDKNVYPANRQIGFVAQEVQKALPELVTQDGKGYLSVDYSKMSVVLLEVIKEQQKQIESYKSETLDIKSQLQSLQEEVAQIKEMLAQGGK